MSVTTGQDALDRSVVQDILTKMYFIYKSLNVYIIHFFNRNIK